MTAIATDFIPYSTHVSVDFGIPSKNIRKIRKKIAAKTLSKIWFFIFLFPLSIPHTLFYFYRSKLLLFYYIYIITFIFYQFNLKRFILFLMRRQLLSTQEKLWKEIVDISFDLDELRKGITKAFFRSKSPSREIQAEATVQSLRLENDSKRTKKRNPSPLEKNRTLSSVWIDQLQVIFRVPITFHSTYPAGSALPKARKRLLLGRQARLVTPNDRIAEKGSWDKCCHSPLHTLQNRKR